MDVYNEDCPPVGVAGAVPTGQAMPASAPVPGTAGAAPRRLMRGRFPKEVGRDTVDLAEVDFDGCHRACRKKGDEYRAWAEGRQMTPNGRLLAVTRAAERLFAENRHWRKGQAAFNALVYLEPECAEAVRCMSVDPFHIDDRLPAFWVFVGNWIGGS